MLILKEFMRNISLLTIYFSLDPYFQGDKDKKIEQLTRELRRQDQLCAAYREILQRFLISIEEQADQLSSKIQDIVENVRKVEAEAQTTLPKQIAVELH